MQWVHTFPVITQKLNFESSIPQISLTLECGRLLWRLSHKFCKCVAEKNETAIFSFTRTYFSIKMAKKEPKRRTYFLRPASLRWGQISETWPNKGHSGNPGIQVIFHNRYAFDDFGNFAAIHHWRLLPRCFPLLYAALGVIVRGWG